MDIDLSRVNTMGSTNSRNKGNSGEDEVRHFFNRNGMHVIDYPQSQDVGTDLIVDVQLEETKSGNILDPGYPVRVQVKTGSSYFSSPGRFSDSDGNVVNGWWFRCDAKHHAYWTTHIDSFLLILVKPEGDSNHHKAPKMYWQWLDDEDRYCATEKSGAFIGLQNASSQSDSHYKVFVPCSQTVDEDFCNMLRKVAYNHWISSRLAPVDIYSFNITEVPTSQHARYALLLPDLTAPHINRSHDHAISWPEALALCVLHCSERWSNGFHGFADQFGTAPSIEESKSSSDAGWRFASWYHDFRFLKGDEGAEGFEGLADLPVELQVAHAVILAVRAYHEKQFDFANQVINAALNSIGADAIDDTDMAWLLIQKGNSLCELAKKDEAASAYAKSQRLTKASKSNESDLTAKLLHSVAVAAIFSLQEPSRGDVGSFISANDNELARFSLRRDAVNFDKLIDDMFDVWSPSGDITIRASDTILVNCQISEDISLLSGNIPAYRHSLSKAAMIELSDRRVEGDAAVRCLFSLLRAGDANRLGQALEKIKRAYGSETVIGFMEELSPDDVTPMTSVAYVKAIQTCGEYLSRSRADEWFAFLISALEDPDNFAEQYTPPGAFRFWPAEAIRCMCSMRYQLGADEMDRIIKSIFTSRMPLESASNEIHRLFVAFNVDSNHSREFITVSGQIPQWLSPILNRVPTAETQENREAIHQEIRRGNLSRIGQIGRVDDFEPDEIAAIINEGLIVLKDICAQADVGMYTGRPIDYGHLTTYLMTHYIADSDYNIDRWWNGIIELLEKPLIDNREKVSAAKEITASIMRVPIEQARKINVHGPMIMKSVDQRELPFDSGDDCSVLKAMLTAVHGRVQGFDEAMRMEACGLGGINRFNVSLLEYTGNPDLPLLAICSSDDFELRYKAFETLVSVCCEDKKRYKEYSGYFSNRCLGGCSDYARGFINTLYRNQNYVPEAKGLLIKLADNHPSSIIRHYAKERLSRQ